MNSPKLEIKLAHTKTTTVLKILTILCGRFKLKAKNELYFYPRNSAKTDKKHETTSTQKK